MASEKLSATAIKAAKPGARDYKMTDGGGLYLLVRQTGSKLWRWNYRYEGKQKTLAFGQYPDVKLAGARDRLREARALLAEGSDPALARKAAKARTTEADSFEAVAAEWVAKKAARLANAHHLAAFAQAIQVTRPFLHHGPARFEVAGTVIGPAQRVAHRVRQLVLDIVGAKA